MRSENVNLHRNNAAEWAMWLAIAPFVYFLRLVRFLTKKG